MRTNGAMEIKPKAKGGDSTLPLGIIYDRGSTVGQGTNYSRGDAKETGIQIAQQNGLRWEYYQELKSAKTLEQREVILYILDKIADSEAQGLIVQELDRLARPEEESDFTTIKNTCADAGILVYTQTGIYDFENDDQVMIGQIKMAVDHNELKKISRRSVRGKKQKAKEGGYLGGPPPLGYKICFELDDKGKRQSWLEIDEPERNISELIFELFIKYGGGGCAKRLTAMGYRGKKGGLFSAATIYDTIRNPIYAGYVVWARNQRGKLLKSYEPVWVHRPELQIISLDTWERAQKVAKKRSSPHKKNGAWGTSPFTGFLGCEKCGTSMVLKSNYKKNRVFFYQCSAQASSGKSACPSGKTHSLGLVAKGVIPFVAELLSLDFNKMLQDAVDKYGYTVTEDELRRQLQGELLSTKEQKQRLVDSISEGILTQDDAKEKMQEVREKIARIERRLDNLGGKAKAREDYIRAMEMLKDCDIEQTLWEMMEKDTAIFRQILGLIFEPSSIRVETFRVKGMEFDCKILDYKFTEGFNDLYSMGDVLRLDTEYKLFVNLSELFTMSIPQKTEV